jgi:hypothetical protein
VQTINANRATIHVGIADQTERAKSEPALESGASSKPADSEDPASSSSPDEDLFDKLSAPGTFTDAELQSSEATKIYPGSGGAHKWLMKNLSKIESDPPPGVYAGPIGDDIVSLAFIQLRLSLTWTSIIGKEQY